MYCQYQRKQIILNTNLMTDWERKIILYLVDVITVEAYNSK